jgi:hypothetical protein
MGQITADDTVRAFDELIAAYATDLSTGEIMTYVQDAVGQLDGSIATEAMPEMVVRLASFRIQRELDWRTAS